MSIQSELEKATGLKQGKADTQTYLENLTRSVASLADNLWDDLSPAAQTWFNEAATALNNEMDLPVFATDVKPGRRVVETKDVEEAELDNSDDNEEDAIVDDDDYDDDLDAEIARLRKLKEEKKAKKAAAKKAAEEAAKKAAEAAKKDEQLEDDATVGAYDFPKQRSATSFAKLVLAETPGISVAELTDIVEDNGYEVKGSAVKNAHDEMTRMQKLLKSAGFVITRG